MNNYWCLWCCFKTENYFTSWSRVCFVSLDFTKD